MSDAIWSRAAALSAMFSATWREPERWRRLAEDRGGGQRYLTLPPRLTPSAATKIQ